jgi:hypothetical protein
VCCTLPPVESEHFIRHIRPYIGLTLALAENYQPKGTFETFNDILTYVIGDKASKKAIVVVTDAMGMVQPT